MAANTATTATHRRLPRLAYLLLPPGCCALVCVCCRGYPIQELTEASYLESAYLVLYGNLPTR